jgi:hypothetical protein
MAVIPFPDRSKDFFTKSFFNIVPMSKEESGVILANTKLKSGGGYTTPKIFSDFLCRSMNSFKMRKVMRFGEQHCVSV